ncbi:MAG: glycine cleavage system protein GcvH [Alphaproteobacteria bacterium]|nr:glycine cleavage system protein GcvH [Alphaproteobacteria bacterium]MBU0795874.1 glycine cleavage system protein GcvH [Alphaproteobacteria bacterium]MBU0888590.1 glycine cleavage system protein GcvH [Alphaproteobacteria bacterium]MBU1813676.1 glycine cleavage system protein GcvH [Alphaproteobacteria bacterium]
MTRKYTEDHEWLEIAGDIATVGITDYAQQQLGDVVFVELPSIGKKVTKGGDAAVVESVKAASEVYSPATGEVVEVNSDLEAAPNTVNDDPHGKGWFFKMKLSNSGELDSLMDEAGYKAFVEGLA